MSLDKRKQAEIRNRMRRIYTGVVGAGFLLFGLFGLDEGPAGVMEWIEAVGGTVIGLFLLYTAATGRLMDD